MEASDVDSIVGVDTSDILKSAGQPENTAVEGETKWVRRVSCWSC